MCRIMFVIVHLKLYHAIGLFSDTHFYTFFVDIFIQIYIMVLFAGLQLCNLGASTMVAVFEFQLLAWPSLDMLLNPNMVGWGILR